MKLRHASRPAAVAVALLALLAGCAPAASTSQPPSAAPVSPIVGVVISIDSAGLNDVRSFELRTNDGRTYVFKVGTLENPTEFPSGHLREHMATSSPVRVSFKVLGSDLIAYRFDDG